MQKRTRHINVCIARITLVTLKSSLHSLAASVYGKICAPTRFCYSLRMIFRNGCGVKQRAVRIQYFYAVRFSYAFLPMLPYLKQENRSRCYILMQLASPRVRRYSGETGLSLTSNLLSSEILQMRSVFPKGCM